MSGRQGIRRGNVAGLNEHVPHPLARDAAMLAANRCNFEASGKPSPRLTSNRRQLLLGFDHPGSQRWLWPGHGRRLLRPQETVLKQQRCPGDLQTASTRKSLSGFSSQSNISGSKFIAV
jgi:hypothetical protein